MTTAVSEKPRRHKKRREDGTELSRGSALSTASINQTDETLSASFLLHSNISAAPSPENPMLDTPSLSPSNQAAPEEPLPEFIALPISSASFNNPQSESFLKKLSKQVRGDFGLVSLPSVFINSLWRGMNLVGIAADGALLPTVYQIGLPVLATAFVTDMARRICQKEGSWREAIEEYMETGEYRESAATAWKLFAGMVGWTIGYAHLSPVIQERLGKLMANALATAMGSALVFGAAAEGVEAFEYQQGRRPEGIDHSSLLQSVIKDAFGAAVWSLVADQNLLSLMQKASVPVEAAKVLDSATVGVSSPLVGCNLLGNMAIAAGSSVWSFFRCARNKQQVVEETEHVDDYVRLES